MATNLVGQTIGKYRIVELIGQGGMAEVYKAHQPSLDRHVAVKVMHSFLVEDRDFTARFQREARVVASMRHPHIVQVYDFDVEGGMPYMVMEYIDGEALKDRLARLQDQGEWLSLDETVRIVLAIGSALKYAHRLGMIHRDIKPANVMIDRDGQVILTDFGIAKILGGAGGSQLTASGAMVGTPAYMSPEQGMGQPGDARSDIYSLGVMLYQLTTGRMPYEADTPLAVVIKHLNEPLTPPRSVKPDLPESIDHIILRALAKNPDERYQHVDEMLTDLKRALGLALDDTPIETMRVTATPPPSVPLSAPTTPAATQVAQPKQRGLQATLAIFVAAILVVVVGGIFVVLVSSGAIGGAPAPQPATPRPTSSLTSTPTPSSSPTSSVIKAIVRQANAELREDPDGNLMYLLETGTELIPHERTADNAWIRVEVRGKSGWVRTEAVDLGTFSVDALPQAPELIKPTVTPDLTATWVACKPVAELAGATLGALRVKANDQFVQTWTIKNTGNCAFDAGSTLVFESGDKLGSPDALDVPAIGPGETSEVKLELVAPALGGSYSAEWGFRRASGDPMGQVSLRLEVIGPTATPPPTRAPTATRAPTVQPTLTPDRNVPGPVGSGDLEASWGGGLSNCVAKQDENDAWEWEADFFIDVHGGNAGYTIDSPACHWDFGQQKFVCHWGARGDGTVTQNVTINCPGCRPVLVTIQASAQIKGSKCEPR